MTGKGLEIIGLSKRIADFTLIANFQIEKGERAALAGPSGSGKTTLLRLIAGLDAPDAGEIRLGGKNLTELPPRKRNVGYIFQDHALFPALDVLENVGFGLRMRGVSRREREIKSLAALERVGMGARARASVLTLSGGEKQRVAFLRAVLWQPELLLCDEPFSALDAPLRVQLRQALVEMHSLWPVPLLFVTHDAADLDAVATVRLELRSTEGGKIRSVARLEN